MPRCAGGLVPCGHGRRAGTRTGGQCGNANVFTGRAGFEATQANAADAARLVNCPASEVFLASTGVIGEILPYQKISTALPGLYAKLSDHGWADAARGIMTTDTFPKAATRTARIGGTTVRIQALPRQRHDRTRHGHHAAFVATDAKLPASVIQALLNDGVRHSFNCITVDSDTSTSDMLLLFATGQAANAEVTEADAPELAEFREALDSLLLELALLVIRDGEGVTKMMHITVTGAVSDGSAHNIAMAVANSPLVKTAVAGEDANWGRVVMAVGKCGEPANRDTLSVSIGGTCIAQNGTVVTDYDETPVVAHMKGQEIEIGIDIGLANGTAQAWGCDLTHGYIDINGSYRS